MHRLAAHFLASAFFIAPLAAQKAEQPRERTEEEILKTVKLPDGYAATVFAKAPAAGYPTSVSAAVDGTLYVAVDENGSLGRARNEAGKPRGKVLRMRDTDGDGRADEIKVFAEMESPRGVIWDGPSGTGPGTLYVMHPPNLTAFEDADGDGRAERQEVIVSGLGFDLGFRGADHTTNGCRLAVDGFIYIAVGDYGFTKAVAKDGTTLSMRSGGIVRVRPDGTGFEIVSRGQRNIYDVAIAPGLDLFTRDNTNDGGGWNVRLSHVPPGAEMGYPTRFINFHEDIVQPLADLGGGSPCGALWIDEPGLQKGLYTVEWGRNAIMFHRLSRDGAGWKHEEQTEWLKLVRPTDMDVDASGAIFISSWEGATFDYNGPHAGYILRVVKKDAPGIEVPKLGEGGIARFIESESGTLRLAAQREAVRRLKQGRDLNPKEFIELARAAAESGRMGAASAAWFGWAMAGRDWVKDFSVNPAKWKTSSVDVRLLTLQVLGNGDQDLASADMFLAGLADSDARVRSAAITGLRRLGKMEGAPEIVPLTADPDFIVAHLAVGALSEMKAAAACLAALDAAIAGEGSDEKAGAIADGALRALYAMPDSTVVHGLVERLAKVPREAIGLRRGVLNALCRLANIDAPYLDPKEWWGTRPDTSGPVYKPIAWESTPVIVAALKAALDASGEDDAKWLIHRMYLAKVNFPGLIDLMLEKAGRDTAARLTAIEGLFRPDGSLPKEAVEALQGVAGDAVENPELRARALRLLQRGSTHGSVFPAALTAFANFAGQEIGQPALAGAFEDFTRDGKNTKWINELAKLATGSDAATRTLAQTILMNLATSSLVKGGDKEKAGKAIDALWSKPEAVATLIAVAGRTGAKQYASEIRAHLKHPDNAVAEAALFAFQKLGLGDEAPTTATIGTLPYDKVFAAAQKGGDAAKGKDVYLRSGCIACHTITPDEPPKGPIMSAVARIYDRAALTESILKPGAKLAQGFESTWIRTKNGDQFEGFVTREGGDNLDLRNIAGQTVLIRKTEIAERGHREHSMMPEGLLNGFTPEELAHLLAYLESLK